MKWSWFGRAAMALTSAVALGLSMTACGGGTVAYLWAIGQNPQQNAGGLIVGFKVDNYTGNLTAIPGQPFSSNDTNPVSIVVRPGGRFLYVLNQGTGANSTSNGSGAGLDLYAIGGEGTLTFEQHYDNIQGFDHLWATFDQTGQYLYVLDKYNPKYQPDPSKGNYDPNGVITTFSSDASTGRLNLVQQNASTQPGQAAPTYLEVGQNPIRMLPTSGCLFTLNGTNNISTYSTANGQLGTVTTGLTAISGATSANSIGGPAAGAGQYVFVTDNTNGSGPGLVYTYTIGGSCALTPLSPGAVTGNSANAINPVNTFLTTSSKYVYVLNSTNTSTQPNSQGSTLSAFSLANGSLTVVTGSPFSVGNGPQCMVEDPTSKFVYTSNGGDGTITGYQYSDTLGQLQQLSRGSLFHTSATTLTCLAISGVV